MSNYDTYFISEERTMGHACFNLGAFLHFAMEHFCIYMAYLAAVTLLETFA